MRYFSLLVVILCAKFGPQVVYTRTAFENVEDEEIYSIKTTTAGFALDAADPNQITIQRFTGSPMQLWKFKRASRPDLSYIVNILTGKVIDWKKNDEDAPTPTSLIAAKFNGSLHQQWYLSANGRITNAESLQNIDVDSSNFVVDNPVIMWKDNGKKGQEFKLERVN